MDNMILAVRRYPRPMRTVIGGVMTLVACIHLGIEGLALMRGNPLVERSLVAGLVAALATALGTLPVLLAQRLSARTQDTLFGFGAGVMLSACAFSLVMPGLAAARESLVGAGAWSAGAVVGAAMLLGGLVLFGLERLLPHEHFIKGREGASAQKLRRTWLFVIAITLHNLPEGIAIGISQAGSEGVRANALAIGIAIQDLPEGLVVASALLAAGCRLPQALCRPARGPLRPGRAARRCGGGARHRRFPVPAALGARSGGRCDVVRDQPRNHSGVASAGA